MIYSQFKRNIGREKMKINELKKIPVHNFIVGSIFLIDVVKMLIILLWKFQQVLLRF